MEWTRSIRDRFLFTFDLSPDGKASVSVSTERDPGSIFLFHLASGLPLTDVYLLPYPCTTFHS